VNLIIKAKILVFEEYMPTDLSAEQIVTKAFLFFLLSKSLIQSYLDKRNLRYIHSHQNKVPEKFEDHISLDDHQKAANYTSEKIKVGSVFRLVNLVLLILWTIGGGLESLNQIVLTLGYSQKVAGIVFFCFFGLISTLLGLPESIYSTFVLEEKFGFNKTTPKIFIIDTIKGLVLGSIIGLPILYGLLWMMEALGDFWWVYGWVFLTLIQFFLLWAYPTFIAPLFNKFSPLEEGEVKEKVLQLLKKTGFTSNGLFVMDASIRSSHGNAYFTGFGKNKRIVFFDTLIKTLTAPEVEAVLAHELGHFKKKHVLKNLIKGIVFSFVGFAILGFLFKWQAFFTGHGVQIQSTYMALCLFSLTAGVYTFFLTPLSAWTSRKYEFEADEFAAKNSQADKLISALVKMYKDNASTLTPDPAYSAFYHSHPPALTRVQFLEQWVDNKE